MLVLDTDHLIETQKGTSPESKQQRLLQCAGASGRRLVVVKLMPARGDLNSRQFGIGCARDSSKRICARLPIVHCQPGNPCAGQSARRSNEAGSDPRAAAGAAAEKWKHWLRLLNRKLE